MLSDSAKGIWRRCGEDFATRCAQIWLKFGNVFACWNIKIVLNEASFIYSGQEPILKNIYQTVYFFESLIISVRLKCIHCSIYSFIIQNLIGSC